MPDIRNTTRAQTRFLRMLRRSDGSYPVEHWPSPLLLRRWLKRDAFREALDDILEALHLQSDLHLARATVRAANDLPDTLFSAPETHRAHLSTIRLSHYHRNSVRRTTPPRASFPHVDPELFRRLQIAGEGLPVPPL
ncbi:MAG TPA: hypothetical protein VFE58_17695 [Tepidisphaeraceae bacterium]|nr:hypothetical protein [Tepidisphaeraceae bacterium]